MRVLAILTIICGASLASNVAILSPPLPLVYAQSPATAAAIVPRHAFEYQSSVQTGDYANFAAVKSDTAGLAPIAALPLPLAASHQYTAPQLLVQPRLIAAPAEPAPIVETVVEHSAPAALVPSIALLAATKTQYHSQDAQSGQAAYGHSEPLQSHSAIQDAAGNKRGSFSYVAPDGRLLTTDYVADEHGYRVASNALPHDANHPAPAVVAAVVLNRRRRHATLVQSTAVLPVVKEATRIDIAGHSSTVRLDTHNVPIASATYALAPAVAPLAYAAHPYVAYY